VTPARPPAGERVLFVTCRPRHHYVIDPLADAVRAAGAEAHVVASDQDSEVRARLRVLGDAAVTSSNLLDHLPVEDAAALVRRSSDRSVSRMRAILFPARLMETESTC
jgi:hypothetical protein